MLTKPLSGGQKDSSWWPAVALGSIALLSWVANGMGAIVADHYNTQWSNYVFYLLPFRFWQLLSGALITDLIQFHPDWLRRMFHKMCGKDGGPNTPTSSRTQK